MSTVEYPTLPKNVSYISLDGSPVNSDSPFPEVRYVKDESIETIVLLFEFKRAGLVGHYRDHIRDLKNGKYDHRWPEDKVEVNRAREIDDYQKEINYLRHLEYDAETNAYVELWYHKVEDRAITS